jgi:DNA polymerase V
MDLVKSYRPETNSISSGQVLQSPYTFQKARIVVEEMADTLSLQLVERRIVTNKMTLTIGYDRESLANPEIRAQYHGEIRIDRYGRQVPKYAHGTASLTEPSSSSRMIIDAILDLYDRITNHKLLIRRITIAANVMLERAIIKKESPMQLDLFTDYQQLAAEHQQHQETLAKERRMQEARLEIKQRFGQNAILKGLNFGDGATGKERNRQIGGHKA